MMNQSYIVHIQKKEYKLSELVKKFKYNKDIYIVNEKDYTHPIWYKNGLQIYVKDTYNNHQMPSHIYYTDKYKIKDIEELACKINYEIHKDKLNFFGYNRIDIPTFEAVRYNVTNREPVKLNCKVEASSNEIMKYGEKEMLEYMKNDIIHGFANSDDFKSLVKFDVEDNYDGSKILYGYIEILKDK